MMLKCGEKSSEFVELQNQMAGVFLGLENVPKSI